MNKPVEHGLAPKLPAREKPAEADAERQRAQRGNDGDAERQLDRGPISRRKIEQDEPPDCLYDVGFISTAKPYFSKIVLAAAERRNAR